LHARLPLPGTFLCGDLERPPPQRHIVTGSPSADVPGKQLMPPPKTAARAAIGLPIEINTEINRRTGEPVGNPPAG
jgi:hypothetical protein